MDEESTDTYQLKICRIDKERVETMIGEGAIRIVNKQMSKINNLEILIEQKLVFFSIGKNIYIYDFDGKEI